MATPVDTSVAAASTCKLCGAWKVTKEWGSWGVSRVWNGGAALLAKISTVACAAFAVGRTFVGAHPTITTSAVFGTTTLVIGYCVGKFMNKAPQSPKS